MLYLVYCALLVAAGFFAGWAYEQVEERCKNTTAAWIAAIIAFLAVFVLFAAIMPYGSFSGSSDY
jgi:heme/copper-type cytochrome/quinol oxidase subunit 3